MLDNLNLGTLFYKNPMLIQQAVLTELQSRLGGTVEVCDPNNSFNFLLEATSQMTADSIRHMETSLAAVYPKRAQTTEHLYKHMSDFDYVGMFGMPTTMNINLILDRKYLINNAKKFNDNYNKVVIPKDTTFYIGKYTFGIHYPIEIQINSNTNSINVAYDSTETNPLHALKHNSVTSSEYTFKGLDILSLQFPVYQFATSIITEDLIPSYGFSKKYKYNDKFYALRAYSVKDSIYTELNYSLSSAVYDVDTPTLQISLMPELNELRVTIPQVYFTKKMLGSKLELIVYTTLGALSVDISGITNNDMTANFAFNSRKTTEFSTILNNISTIIIQPTEDRLVGGTNGFTYEELRTYVVNDTLYESVPVTPIELQHFFNKKGFVVQKHLDNITDRIYYGYRELTDGNNTLVPVTNAILNLTNYTPDVTTTVVKNLDGSFTILPTTVYEYSATANECRPLTDAERISLFDKQPAELATALNAVTYTKSPFHIRVIPDGQYPRAESYNLMTPTGHDLMFLKDNLTMSAQLIVVTHDLAHLANGAGGYRLRFGIQKQEDFESVSEDDILVYGATTTLAGNTIGLRASYVGIIGTLAVYEIVIGCNYSLDTNNYLGITTLETVDSLITTQYINLESNFDIIIAVKRGVFENVTNDSTITHGLPTRYTDYIGSSRQRLTCTFGKALGETVLNNLNINWTAQEYAVYPDDIAATYAEDVYEHNPDGTLATTIVEGVVQLNKLHSEGEVILDAGGLPIIKYVKGEVKRDVLGLPIVVKDREVLYLIDCMQFDLRLFHTDDVVYDNFEEELPNTIESYLSIVSEASTQLLERTELYFRPINTLGLGKFSLGDSVVVGMPLDLSFAIKFYVPSYVYSDSKILGIIKTATIKIIESELKNTTISLTAMSNRIKSELSEYIETVDVGGINSDVKLQTLMITDTSMRPTIRQNLVYSNETLKLEKAVDVTFVQAI